jgi:probable F420-dependent oxidoreductase
MRLGLFTMNAYSCSQPDTAIDVARTAEASGFESLWCGEHVVMPEPAVGREPLGPRDPILDPLIALAHLAGATKSVRLATGIVILPIRDPLVLAKQLSSLDVLSSGRLMFGFGVGWLEPEFDALGVPFVGRGERADEYLRAMVELWTADKPSFDGRFVKFSGVQSRPQPVSRPYPTIVVGGESRAALARAVKSAHGWFGGLLLEENLVASQIAALHELTQEIDRPEHLGELEITVSVKGDLDPARVEHLAAIGVHRLVIVPRPRLHDQALVEWVGKIGDQLNDVSTPAR